MTDDQLPTIIEPAALTTAVRTDTYIVPALIADAGEQAGIAKVQEWLGHANIATTRIYDHRRTRPEDSPTFKVAY